VSGVLTPVLTAHWDQPDSFTLAGYRREGGYRALEKALGMPPDDVVAALKG
jgi:NADH-quinone oxidoreductase subunit F